MKIQDLNPKVVRDLVRLLSITIVVFMITTAICGSKWQAAKQEVAELKDKVAFLDKGLAVATQLNDQLMQENDELADVGKIKIWVTVKKGDWLSKYAKEYLGDPHRWPEIWKLNPHIKNPHLIYPGQEVRIQ